MGETSELSQKRTSRWRLILSKNEREAIEREAKREIREGHALFGSDMAAIARRDDNDDALFEVAGDRHGFAVVHLTWSSTEETNPTFPFTRWYDILSEWLAQLDDA